MEIGKIPKVQYFQGFANNVDSVDNVDISWRPVENQVISCKKYPHILSIFFY